MRIATWNVRTMLVVGKIEELGRILEEYRLGILTLQEQKWQGERIDNRQYTRFYEGEKKNRVRGVQSS